MGYSDIREYLSILDQKGLLIHVSREINKDTELSALVRWQFRGIPQNQRKGWLFECLTDCRGRSFDAKVAVAINAPSPAVYAAAMGVDSVEEIGPKWREAIAHPLNPVEIKRENAPVKEVILSGKQIVDSGGIDQFPVPVMNPGYDAAAYFSCPIWITKDPETGVYNAGTYRVQVKAPDRAGVYMLPGQDGLQHWNKARLRGEPLEAVLCLSPIPALSLCSATKLLQSEYEVAGAINGAPLEVVKAETVDLLVPATAEIIIEGHFRTDVFELEGPFGEFAGYGGHAANNGLVFEVTAITHRRKPILQAFISEMPPSESSLMRKIGNEELFRSILREKIASFRDVCLLEEGGATQIIVMALHKPKECDVHLALHAAAGASLLAGKWIIAVDDDIDITDLSSIAHALSWRVQPHRDIEIQRGMLTLVDPSGAPQHLSFAERSFPDGVGGSRMLIDATMKWPYPPISLPWQDYMIRAMAIWEDLGLPPLQPRVPWFGYSLGYWPKEWQEAAELATKGQYLTVGERWRQHRSNVDDDTLRTMGL